jgi:hypothetical protein
MMALSATYNMKHYRMHRHAFDYSNDGTTTQTRQKLTTTAVGADRAQQEQTNRVCNKHSTLCRTTGSIKFCSILAHLELSYCAHGKSQHLPSIVCEKFNFERRPTAVLEHACSHCKNPQFFDFLLIARAHALGHMSTCTLLI